MRNLLKILGIALLVVFFNRIDVLAVTFDNDGSARDNPYGDAGFASSFGGDVGYYDCYLPYGMTVQEVGGYAIGAANSTSSSYTAMPETVYDWPAGTRCSYESNDDSSYINATMTFESDTGMEIYTDANGNQYYATAIQHFFYNNSSAGTNNFPGWGLENRGQVFDVVLTDGTVIHFVVADANAIQHTNSGSDDNEGSFDVTYTFADSSYPQYKHMMGATAGNCLEVWGSSSACVNKFMNKYNMGQGEDKNQIAYYRMYNIDIDDNVQRAGGVGTAVSYNLGNVSISSSSGSGSEEATDSLGNVIVSEADLIGMNGLTSSVLGNQQKVELATREDLSVGEQYSVVTIGEDVALAKQALSLDNARILVVFVGLVMVFYGVLLLMCMLLDKANSFFEISFVRIITLGALQFTEEDELKHTKGYASLGKMLTVIVIVFIIGCLLISGGLIPFMMSIVEWIKNLF